MAVASDRELLAALIERARRDITAAWDDLVSWLEDQFTDQQIADMLARGDLSPLYQALDQVTATFTHAVKAIVITVGMKVSEEVVSQAIGARAALDATYGRLVAGLQRDRLRLVREVVDAQREAWTQIIARGIDAGTNPRAVARELRDSIGLTGYQEQMVANYEDLLRRGSREALSRQLRDRRFDPSVERAAAGGAPLSEDQVERMVNRYRARLQKLRAETIARTEALRSVHEGAYEAYSQALERGEIDAHEIERQWLHHNHGRYARAFHEAMNGQVRALDEPFVSGLGNKLRFPCDPDAPAVETISCRCGVATRLNVATQEAAA